MLMLACPLVNVAPFFESLASSSSLGHPFTSRQVNQTHLAHFLPRILFTAGHISDHMTNTQKKDPL